MKNTLKVALIAVTGMQLFAGNLIAASYKQADKTGASIAEFVDEMANLRKEVDNTMSALGKIVADASVDPRDAYKEFEKSVGKVDAVANKAKKRAEDIKANGQDYFKKWEKELAAVNNPEVRALAEQRKAKLQESFGKIQTTMVPAKEQFNAWLGNLKDLQKYLSNDLTIQGIDAAKELIAKTTSEGQAVQQTVIKATTELNTIVAAITPAKVEKKK